MDSLYVNQMNLSNSPIRHDFFHALSPLVLKNDLFVLFNRNIQSNIFQKCDTVQCALKAGKFLRQGTDNWALIPSSSHIIRPRTSPVFVPMDKQMISKIDGLPRRAY